MKDDFISEQSELRARLSGAKLSVSLPSAAKWEEKAAAFRKERHAAPVPVTVSSEVSAEPYGEKTGKLKSLFRRAVRRSIRWYAEPLVERQNEVNRALLERINELEAELRELKEKKEE